MHRNGQNTLLILLFLLIGIVSFSCNGKEKEIRVLFVGDILLSRNVAMEYRSENTDPWEKLHGLFNSSDLVIGNLEGAVGKAQDSVSGSKSRPLFSINANDLDLLKNAGFDAIGIENNHSLDLGEEGKYNTARMLTNKKIDPISFENSPRFFTVKKTTISIIAINMISMENRDKTQVPSIEAQQKIRLAKTLSDAVVIYIHWGSELLEWPDKKQREAAAWLVDQGADLIIGSHPHVVQNPEMIKGKPVFFSLGNHLFDQKYQRTKEGIIADIRFKNGKIYCHSIKTGNRENSFYPEITENTREALPPVNCTPTGLSINGYDIRPVSSASGNKYGLKLQGYKKNKKIWETHTMSIVSAEAARFGETTDFLFLLETHYSSLDKENSLRPYVYLIDNDGLLAKWRGSALAWPLLDACISGNKKDVLCALHRGDSFINPDKKNKIRRTSAYRWNGFGFTAIYDSSSCNDCEHRYK